MWIYWIVSRNRPSLSIVSPSSPPHPFLFRDPRRRRRAPFRSGIRCFLIIPPSRAIVHGGQSATETRAPPPYPPEIFGNIRMNGRPEGQPAKGTAGRGGELEEGQIKKERRERLRGRARGEHAELVRRTVRIPVRSRSRRGSF